MQNLFSLEKCNNFTRIMEGEEEKVNSEQTTIEDAVFH